MAPTSQSTDNYYQLLEVAPNATRDEIKRSYRRLALRCHPDRHPDDPDAEERFKRITLAYGVLSDPERRRAYDREQRPRPSVGTSGSRSRADSEEVLRDLFASRDFQEMFARLMGEFERRGLRTDRGFLRKVLGPGALVIFGGLLIGGPLLGGRAALLARALRVGQQLVTGARLLQRVRHPGERPSRAEATAEPISTRHYRLALGEALCRTGGTIEVTLPTAGGDSQRLTLQIPPGTHAGDRFQLDTSDGSKVTVEIVRRRSAGD